MAILSKGNTFADGDQVTSTKLNNLVDNATFIAGSSGTTDNATLEVNGSGRLQVKTIQTGNIANSAVTTAKIADGAVTSAKLAADAAVPAGAVMPFAMNSAPFGWLAANGDAVSRSTYAALFSAIGTTHGSGDGSTTFNLPDLRGIFVRGSGSQAISGITYNKTFAAKEGDALQGHRHLVKEQDGTQVIGSTLNASGGGSGTVEAPDDHAGINRGNTEARDVISDTINGTPRIASETRPANIALLYCIKT